MILLIIFGIFVLGSAIYWYKKNVIDFIKKEQEEIKKGNKKYIESDFG